MNIKRKFMIFLTALIFICSGLFLNAGKYSFSGYLPRVKKAVDAVVIKIDTPGPQNNFYIHYRTEGLENFQVRKMKTDKQGNHYHRLPTDNLYGKTIEYFIAGSDNPDADTLLPVFTVTGFTGQGSPEIYFLGAEKGPVEGKTGSKFKLPLKINASLSATSRVYDNSESPGKSFDANGNIRLSRSISGKTSRFDFDTNISYMHNAVEPESKFNLASMKVNLKSGNHFISAGDVNVSGTEFTTPSLNRRGLLYKMEGKHLYLGSFFINAQQKSGFEGFGIPPSDANILGAEAGVRIGSFLNLQGMFMTGKDNLESKTVVTSDDAVKYREGSVYSIRGELKLLKKKLVLNGEFAHSNFGEGADSGSTGKESDKAWRAAVNYGYRFLTFRADYKKVGEKYSSIGNLFLLNDRQGLNSTIGLSIKSFSFNLGYRDEKTNMNNDVQPMLHTKNINTNFNWIIDKRFKLGGEFSLNNLDYAESTGTQTGSRDMDTIRYAAALGYISGPNGITVKLGKTESKTFSSNIDGSVNIFLKFGKVLSLSPTFSYQSTKNFTDASTSKIYSAYINGVLTFIPGYFNMTITASGTKNANSSGDITSISVGGNLNFQMGKLFKQKIKPNLSLRSQYRDYRDSKNAVDKSSAALYLQFDLSF